MQSSRPASRPKPLNWPPPSHTTVFIRNLRLLQLDQLKDWPGITTRTLSPSQQNLRQRVKAVEWALYRLFTIWDPEGTQNKLRPFFPPLEPLQSVNLRAALFRALSELKKNGDLGRETILRKTMLDDCKGEKFDEVLADFSTAVVRKVLTATGEWAANPALRLSTARGITPEEHQMMVPLILAHQVSLGAMGERRSLVRTTYDKFSQLLESKKTELASRSKENGPSLPDEPTDFDRISREVKENWLGSEEWANTLLYGGSRSSTDGFLELPFSEAWSRAKESTVEDLSNAPTQDLLIDLESRVSHQRNRLRKWREFSDSIQKKETPTQLTQSNNTNVSPLVFRDHQSLTVASISKAVRNPVGRTNMRDNDLALLSSVNEALARINGKPTSARGVASPVRAPAVATETVERQSPLPSPTKSDQRRPVFPAETNTENIRSLQKEREQGSPIIHVTSEHATKPEPEPEPEPESGPNSESHAFTLVERTRKSMSLVPPPSSRMRENHHHPPRKPPQSFPVNQFETPRKPSPHRSGASTPRDDLFDENADYASVFKSRPRIAQSPIASPAVHVSSFEEFDLDGNGNGGGTPWSGNGDYDERDMENSPLFSRRRA